MSAEESKAQNRDAPTQRKPRLKLIDIYTKRGAFSGDELKGIADKVREITSPSTSLQPISETEKPLIPDKASGEVWGEASGEASGEVWGEVSRSIDSTEDTYPTENREIYSPDPSYIPFTPHFTPHFTLPYSSPHSSPYDSPHTSPHTSPHVSPDVSPRTSPHTSPPVCLTENQAILYFCLQHLDGAITSISRLSQATSISEHTLKSCLKKLRHEGLIDHRGRKQSQGLTGFSALVVHHNISLLGEPRKLARKLQQINYDIMPLTTQLSTLTAVSPDQDPSQHPSHPTLHPTLHPTVHPTLHPTGAPSCSSIKKQLLQELIYENAFQDLNPRSLLPYLDKFETSEALQDFLDMANACILAAKEGRGKPIQNPHGFLFAQLRAGYINPPEGYKSRRIRAQEMRNQRLEEELRTLKRLKEREEELLFGLFVAQLTSEDLIRLEHEAQAQMQPHIGLSAAFQLQMHKDTLLKQWFAHRERPQDKSLEENH